MNDNSNCVFKNLIKTFGAVLGFVTVVYLVLDLLQKDEEDSSAFEDESGDNRVDEIETKLSKLSSRKRKIVKLLQDSGSVTVPSISSRFPDISDRTIRRDMNDLEDIGLIERRGSTKATKYYLK
jgi:predicted HTH transcriptional regulator